MTKIADPVHWQYLISDLSNVRWLDGQFFSAIDYAIAVAVTEAAKAKVDQVVCLSTEPLAVHVLARRGNRLPRRPKLGLLRLIGHDKLTSQEVAKANRQVRSWETRRGA